MRNNPGGVLGAAVDVSDAFIKGKKKLVFTKGKKANAVYEYFSKGRLSVFLHESICKIY
mgnify:CR=1 FL=1